MLLGDGYMNGWSVLYTQEGLTGDGRWLTVQYWKKIATKLADCPRNLADWPWSFDWPGKRRSDYNVQNTWSVAECDSQKDVKSAVK